MGTNSSILGAVTDGDLISLKQLLSNQPNNEIEGALSFAAANQTLPIQKIQCVAHLLLQFGADINSYDELGWTCLHRACHANNILLLPFLLSNGALVTRDVYGFLPQDYIDIMDVNDKSIVTLLQKTPVSEYSLKVPHTIEAGSCISVHYNKPSNCSTGGYIQLVYCHGKDALPSDIFFGDYVNIPTETGENNDSCVTFNTIDLPQPITCRFLYVHSDKGKMSRRVVASSGPVVVKVGVSRYSFTVNGIPFYHSHERLNGKIFSTPEEFRDFMTKNCFGDRKEQLQKDQQEATVRSEGTIEKAQENNVI